MRVIDTCSLWSTFVYAARRRSCEFRHFLTFTSNRKHTGRTVWPINVHFLVRFLMLTNRAKCREHIQTPYASVQRYCVLWNCKLVLLTSFKAASLIVRVTVIINSYIFFILNRFTENKCALQTFGPNAVLKHGGRNGRCAPTTSHGMLTNYTWGRGFHWEGTKQFNLGIPVVGLVPSRSAEPLAVSAKNGHGVKTVIHFTRPFSITSGLLSAGHCPRPPERVRTQYQCI